MLDKIITYSFYLLFLLVPLFWTSFNHELFEYNKMILTYIFTVIIVGTWILKMIQEKSLIFKRTPLDIPLLLFLGANIISTLLSIDRHTSIWGYYSRSNGGLLSIISYLLLYWAFVSNFDKEKVLNTLKFGLVSGFLISLWAILEHFGVSLSCVLLRGEFTASCWVQDVQARVFASLGQPNWLAAYLAMLIFPSLYFYLTATTQNQRIIYFLSLITMYLAFTFTYSRGPTLGLVGGILVFLALYFIRNTQKTLKVSNIRESVSQILRSSEYLTHPIFRVLLSFLIINLLFGSALTSFKLISKFASPPRPALLTSTQLENGGTESGQIRLIVWQGALDIFKHYPIFGSGVETFAYSYYQFRPAEHNLVSEWDFLYNKAHNEYLNYLATTGVVGIGTYLLVIGTFIVYGVSFIVYGKKPNKPFTINHLLFTSLLAAYISYLIYNFFLFSVVIIAIFFYLFPAMAFIVTESTKTLKVPRSLNTVYQILNTLIYRRPLYTKVAKGLIILSILFLLFSIFKIWYADTIFAKGQSALDNGNAGSAYNYLSAASTLNSSEPLFRAEKAFAAASAALALKDTDATVSAELKNEAISDIETVLKNSPKNVSFWRTAIRVYFELSNLDKSYTEKTLEAVNTAISLAPTDPKLYYNKGLILDLVDRKEEAISAFQKALELKPDYLEAHAQLQEATNSEKL